MRKGTCVWGLLFLLFTAAGARGEGNCWVVAIATNQDQRASEDWNQYGEEFALAFKTNTKGMYRAIETKTILGRQARLDQIAAAMRWVANNARPQDFVAIYVGCHGGTDRQDGWGIGTIDGQFVWGRDFKSVAARLPCPVLFVIDTCGSGGFARAHAKDIPLPPNCVAICSSRARQSTTNCLNIALHEALWGIADANQDRFIDVDETVRYIEARTRKLSAPSGNPKEGETPVTVVGGNISPQMKLTQVTGEQVAILQGGAWHLGRVLSEQGETCKVHIMGYQDNPNLGFFVFNEAPRNRIFKLDDGAQPVLVKNEDASRVRPALLLGAEGDQAKVRFVLMRKGKREALVDRSLLQFPFKARGPMNGGARR